MSEFSCFSCIFAVLLACAQTGAPPAWQEALERGVFIGQKIELKSVETSEWALKDAAAAAEKARRVLGVPQTVEHVTAQLTKLEEDNTPFLVMKLLDRPLWQVVVYDWKLDFASAPSAARQKSYTRTFDVLIRPEDGRVLKIRSRWPEGEPMMAPEFGAGDATCHLFGSGYTIFHAFPDSDPRVSLLEALLSLYDGLGGDPLTAKQILAIPVVWSNCYYQTPRTVWVINLRGVMPAWPYTGPPKYEWRFTLDAATGKLLGSGNVQQRGQETESERDRERQ